MGTSSSNNFEISDAEKERIEHQYDSLIKKSMVGEAKNYMIEITRRSANEIYFSDMEDYRLEELLTDEDFSMDMDYEHFNIYRYEIQIKNEMLSEALKQLPPKKRDIVLLSYFLDMSDIEIAKRIHLVRTTVFRHRKDALKKLKKYMKGGTGNEQEK